MKHFVLTFVLLQILIIVCGQNNKKKDQFFLWDSQWNNATDIKKATFFSRVRFVNDTCWRFYNYKIGGPMATMEEFKDPEGTIPHGRFSYMRRDGMLDSMGYVFEGKLNGTWYFFNDTGRLKMRKEYSMGELVSTWIAPPKKDSGSYTLKEGEIESRFPGPNGSWIRYLSSNLNYPKVAAKGKIQGTVIINFVVDATGGIADHFILKSVEYTLDDEATRLISESPKWIPAEKDGKKVNSYKTQPIQFRVE
jgi:TonB family protein